MGAYDCQCGKPGISYRVKEGSNEIAQFYCGPKAPICISNLTLREQLAALEHEQWFHWTRYFLNNLTPENIERWQRQCATPYELLTEKEKDSDREWADKVLLLIDANKKEP